MGGPPRGGPLPSTGSPSELDRLRSTVALYFPVYETRVGPQSLVLTVHVDRATLAEKFDGLRRELWPLFYVPVLHYETGEYTIEVIRRPVASRKGFWINVALLAATFATTDFAGALVWLSYEGQTAITPDAFLWGGLFFALPLMLILGVHELAHYALSRHHHLEASLPYFMPIPPPFLFGTLGAFISIRQPFTDRKALFDVGAAGPIAGFLVAVPITIAGLFLTAHSAAPSLAACGPTLLDTSYSNLQLGTPLLWQGLAFFVPISSNIHPLAFAGWVGVLVTSINLLPSGQLDGGHVWRALAGDRVRYVSYAVVGLLFVLGFFYFGWFLFGSLILILGVRHPPPLNDITPVGLGRVLVGIGVAVILVAGFVIVPVSAPSGAIGFSNASVQYGSETPGSAVAANLSVTVQNPDGIAHGFYFSTTVQNVSIPSGNSTWRYLNGSAFTEYAINSTWTFYLPNGTMLTFQGASVSIPSADFIPIGATSSAPLVVHYSNPAPAHSILAQLGALEVCPPIGGGSATMQFTIVPP